MGLRIGGKRKREAYEGTGEVDAECSTMLLA
jgi:hypothetical protein